MVLLAAMGLGALIGGVAGLAVYATKAVFSESTEWNTRDALAHAAGGVVGGGLFPPLLVGLSALGLPAAASYVVSGGLAWGGLWTLAQDAASWGLGRSEGLGSPARYAIATGIGLVVSAALLPLAGRVISSGSLLPHNHAPEAYLLPAQPVAPNVVKAETEFLLFGAGAEALSPVVSTAGRVLTGAAEEESVAPTHSALPVVNLPLGPGGEVAAPAATQRAPESVQADDSEESAQQPAALPERSGLIDALEGGE